MNPDTPFDLALLSVIIGTFILVLTVARITVVIERTRTRKFVEQFVRHTCPAPEIKVEYIEIERNHNPWTPLPWKEATP